jgi:hypothetical protein
MFFISLVFFCPIGDRRNTVGIKLADIIQAESSPDLKHKAASPEDQDSRVAEGAAAQYGGMEIFD